MTVAYFKRTENGYVILIGTGIGGQTITREEYESILAVIAACPVAEPGYTYRLRTDLTWELLEIPYVEYVENDEDATEADYHAALEEFGVNV